MLLFSLWLERILDSFGSWAFFCVCRCGFAHTAAQYKTMPRVHLADICPPVYVVCFLGLTMLPVVIRQQHFYKTGTVWLFTSRAVWRWPRTALCIDVSPSLARKSIWAPPSTRTRMASPPPGSHCTARDRGVSGVRKHTHTHRESNKWF